MRLNLDNFGDDYEQYRERSVRAKTNDNQRVTSENFAKPWMDSQTRFSLNMSCMIVLGRQLMLAYPVECGAS